MPVGPSIPFFDISETIYMDGSTPTVSFTRSEPATVHKLPLLDFTYLYDDSQPDFTDFMAGRILSEEQV
jgi:hypothetical protein